MADLLNLEDAAQLLNITNDELVKFTADNAIKGYRDGADTKYKKSDLEEFASARGIELFDSELLDQLEMVGGDDAAERDTSDDTLAGDPLGMDDDSFSLLDDEMEGDGEDSVLITKQDLNALEVAAASEPEDPSGASDDGPLGLADDDLDFDLEDDSTILPDSGGTGLLDDDMDFDTGDESTIMADSSMDLGLGDADTDDDTQLGVVDSFGVTDEALVLGSPDSSDLTLGAPDSGITLESPSDSGILLDAEEIDLSDSAVTQLELPGAGDGLEVLMEDDKSFNLGTPDGADEMSDSGSQIIAISDSAPLEDAPLEQIELTDALGGSLDQLTEVGPGTSPVPAGIAPPPPEELGYSAWIVLCLMMITLVLVVTGMMMADVVKTMWSWNEGTELSSSLIMDWIIGLFNMRPGP
jgi:excisionase family DNA binding protein